MTDWVAIETAVMKAARTAKGLSYESASRLLHVSSKTYERREKAGRWPRHDVEHLAEVLGLEIDRSTRERFNVEEEVPADLVARLEAVADLLASTAHALTEVLEAQALPGPGAEQQR